VQQSISWTAGGVTAVLEESRAASEQLRADASGAPGRAANPGHGAGVALRGVPCPRARRGRARPGGRGEAELGRAARA
jgi:hypothetical protein